MKGYYEELERARTWRAAKSYASTKFYREFFMAISERNHRAVAAKDGNLKCDGLDAFMGKFKWVCPALDFSPCHERVPRFLAYAGLFDGATAYMPFTSKMPEMLFWGIRNERFVHILAALLSRFV